MKPLRKTKLFIEISPAGELVRRACGMCNEVKLPSDFHKSNIGVGGVTSRCKSCSADLHKKRVKTLAGGVAIPLEKMCSKCGEIKPKEGFGKYAASLDGLRSCCRDCRVTGKKFVAQKDMVEKACSVCKATLPRSEFSSSGKPGSLMSRCKACSRKYSREYYPEHREEQRSWARGYQKRKLKEDALYSLAHTLRGRMNVAIYSGAKSGSAVRDLGCSIEELKFYLESKFYPHPETGEEMSWDNRGRTGWHIDHIVPLSSVNLEDREQFLKVAHYTNLQPLWAIDNLKKGGRIL